MSYLNRSTFKAHKRRGQLAKEVTCYSLPIGALCEVQAKQQHPVLTNLKMQFFNTNIAQMLANAGIYGHVLIYRKNSAMPPRNMLRWLANVVSLEDNSWMDEIIVYTLWQRVRNVKLPFTVEQLPGQRIPAEDVMCHTLSESSADNFDGVLVVSDSPVIGKTLYRLLPIRRIEATMVGLHLNHNDQLADCLVAKVNYQGNEYLVKTARYHHDIKRNLYAIGYQAIGRRVILEYTSFTHGNRICNFNSALAISIDTSKG